MDRDVNMLKMRSGTWLYFNAIVSQCYRECEGYRSFSKIATILNIAIFIESKPKRESRRGVPTLSFGFYILTKLATAIQTEIRI